MNFLQLTGTQLNALGNWSVSGTYILVLMGRVHIRLDQKRFPSGNLSEYIDGDWNYRISSFHVKIDATHEVTVNTVKIPVTNAETGKQFFKNKKIKTIDDWSDYLYFKFVGGGVWQPIWGYAKFASQTGGKVTNTHKADLPDSYWGDLMAYGRNFIGTLTKATKTDQGMAHGPIQASRVNLFNQL